MNEPTSSSMVFDTHSTLSIKEYPVESEEIDDESTDSEYYRQKERKIRLKSLYNIASSSAFEVSQPLSVNLRKFIDCTQCQKPITELVIWALNKPYHCNCFVCFACKKSVAFKKFKVLDKKLITCFKDFYESYQKCRFCQGEINGEVKLEYEKLYHEDCYKCVSCLQPLKDESVVALFDESYCRGCAASIAEKKNYLHAHYEALNRSFQNTTTDNSSLC